MSDDKFSDFHFFLKKSECLYNIKVYYNIDNVQMYSLRANNYYRM